MFIQALSSLNLNTKVNQLKPVISNFVFKLHYTATVLMLVVAFVLVYSREYFSEHIKCIADEGIPGNVTDSYCYHVGTFTIVRNFDDSEEMSGLPAHPGVGPQKETDEIIMHRYYQWTGSVLLIQAICFYMPHYFWKRKEGGRMKALVDGLQFHLVSPLKDIDINGKKIQSEYTLEQRIQTISKDFFLRLRLYRSWSFTLILMEFMNLLHLISQIWLTNLFLNGNFITLGLVVIGGDWNAIAQPLEYVFPKVTKCIFHKFGPSGTIQQHDALCVMALNMLHEKIYSVLWFWYLMLLVLTVSVLIWRLLTFCLYRHSMFTRIFYWPVYSPNMSRYKEIRHHNLTAKYGAKPIHIVKVLEYTDWLFLYYLWKNMNRLIFHDLLQIISMEAEKRIYGKSSNEEFSVEQTENKDLTKLVCTDETQPMQSMILQSTTSSHTSLWFDSTNNVRDAEEPKNNSSTQSLIRPVLTNQMSSDILISYTKNDTGQTIAKFR